MSGEQPEVAALQADIERTREELAQTVDQLTAKLDVKSRIRARVTTPEGRPTNPVLVVGGVAVAAVLAAVVLTVRRRR